MVFSIGNIVALICIVISIIFAIVTHQGITSDGASRAVSTSDERSGIRDLIELICL